MSKTLKLGDVSDTCLNCGETRDAIKYSQSHKDPIYCVTLDYFGEAMSEFDHHSFVVTQAHVDELKAEEEYWNHPDRMKELATMDDYMNSIGAN